MRKEIRFSFPENANVEGVDGGEGEDVIGSWGPACSLSPVDRTATVYTYLVM